MDAAIPHPSVSEVGDVVPRSADVDSPNDDLRWTALPLPAQLYVAAVLVGGAATLVAFFPKSLPQPVMFALLTLFACVTSAWKVNLPIAPTGGSTLSVLYAANLMALLLLGPQPAVLVAMAGVWTQCTYKAKKPYPLYRTMFSIAAEVMTMAATGVMYHELGGPTVPLHAAGLARPLVGAIGTYFLVNTGLVAGAIGAATGRSFLTVWRDDFLWSGASFMVAGSAGAMAAVVVDRGEQWKAILLIAPIYLTYRTYELFVGRLEDNTRHIAEMRELHQGTVDALMKARRAERAEQEARAAAERANRTKDEFLAIVSHELRTPLTSILGWADMLRRGRLDDARRQRAFQAIYDSARRQTKLIDDLLDVSRIMSGKLRLERTIVSIKDIIDDAIQVVQPAADAKDVHISSAADASRRHHPGRQRPVAAGCFEPAVERAEIHAGWWIRRRYSCRARPTTSSFRFAIPARASPQNFCRTCSNRFVKPTARPRVRMAASDLGCRSSSDSSTRITARLRRTVPASAAVRPSSCAFPLTSYRRARCIQRLCPRSAATQKRRRSTIFRSWSWTTMRRAGLSWRNISRARAPG